MGCGRWFRFVCLGSIPVRALAPLQNLPYCTLLAVVLVVVVAAAVFVVVVVVVVVIVVVVLALIVVVAVVVAAAVVRRRCCCGCGGCCCWWWCCLAAAAAALHAGKMCDRFTSQSVHKSARRCGISDVVKCYRSLSFGHSDLQEGSCARVCVLACLLHRPRLFWSRGSFARLPPMSTMTIMVWQGLAVTATVKSSPCSGS